MALQQEYFSIPPITRAYTTTCLLTTIAVVSDCAFPSSIRFLLQQLEFITAYQLYFNPELIFKRFQVLQRIRASYSNVFSLFV